MTYNTFEFFTMFVQHKLEWSWVMKIEENLHLPKLVQLVYFTLCIQLSVYVNFTLSNLWLNNVAGIEFSHYIGNFHDKVKEFIIGIIDVPANGNCGYQVVANQLGFGEDGWHMVRKDLLRELITQENEYHFDGEIKLDLKERLSFFQNDKFAPESKWMLMPYMGHLIASFYEVVVIYFSQHQCLTFCPLRSPTPNSDPNFIYIGYANSHYFEVS